MKHHERCCDSLAWLEAEGYATVKLCLQNEKTGKVDTINLNREGFLGLEDSSATEEQLNMMLRTTSMSLVVPTMKWRNSAKSCHVITG